MAEHEINTLFPDTFICYFSVEDISIEIICSSSLSLLLSIHAANVTYLEQQMFHVIPSTTESSAGTT